MCNLILQGDDLIIGHVGHSRAVLGTRVHDNSVVALQLTNVLEDSSVGALLNKASVRRIFLPNKTIPGLVRARAWASGEYQLEEYHEISKPEIMTQRLSKKDEFVVLATDGVHIYSLCILSFPQGYNYQHMCTTHILLG